MPKLLYSVPQSARNNARRALELKEKHGDEVKGMDETGWRRARQLANNATVSRGEAQEIKAWFARHGANASTFAVDPKFKDEPHRDNGYIAYLGWGGGAMQNASEKWNFDDD